MPATPRQRSAAIRIQTFWRTAKHHSKTLRSVKDLVGSGTHVTMLSDRLTALGYEAMMEAIKKPEFILLFRVFLHNIMESVQKRHLPGVQAIIIPDSKVVTAAYLIALYPRKVMENMNEELTRLALHAAKALVASLERVMRYVVDRVVFRDIPHEATLEFLTTIQEYMVHFRNWQIPDSARIVLRIKTALVALHHARVGAMQNQTSTAGLMAEFARQIERLRGKLVQLRGPAELAAHDLELQGGGL